MLTAHDAAYNGGLPTRKSNSNMARCRSYTKRAGYVTEKAFLICCTQAYGVKLPNKLSLCVIAGLGYKEYIRNDLVFFHTRQ